jgi:hypothetical protein
MIALPARDGKGFLQAAKNRRETAQSFTRSLEKITLTPNFGQAPDTLDCDIVSVASKARSGARPDSSAPQPPGLGRPGQLSSAYGSIPKRLRAGFTGPIFICASACGRGS